MRAKASREKKGSWKWALLLVGLAPVLLNSCAEMQAPSPAMSHDSASPWNAPSLGGAVPAGSSMRESKSQAVAGAPNFVQKPVPPRPGLGTTWGESMSSPITYTGFRRASTNPAHGFATIWYNDRKGINAMTNKKYYTGAGRQRAAGGLVEWGIKSSVSTLRSYHSGGRRFVMGRKGARYSIVVKNHARSRLEVVLSVDGRDVLDGKKASKEKRGYIVWPGRTLEVKGWRSSAHEVAAFRFSSVSSSYSALKGEDTSNVGVVGMAVFTERGIDPWNGYSAESSRRFSASPFAEAPLHRAH